jgi:hypothetical protein
MKYMLIGPQGIGKSRHSGKIAAALGVTRVLDDGSDWPDDLEAAFVANTLFISNTPSLPITPETIVFSVRDEADLLLLIVDLNTVPFDPSSARPDIYKSANIGDTGTVLFEGSLLLVTGRVIGVYPGSIRVAIYRETHVQEISFLRTTGMASRARITFLL